MGVINEQWILAKFLRANRVGLEGRLSREVLPARRRNVFRGSGSRIEPAPHAVYTWPDPEDEQFSKVPQRITWRITPSGPGTVKLTMLHEEMTEKAYQGVSEGWPAILSGLKTLLETGRPPQFNEPRCDDKN